jgi:hypothetical protein
MPKGNRQYEGMLSGTGAAIMGNSMMGGSSFSDGQKITLNLEDVVLHEQKLYNILENLRNDQNASLSCEDWWDLTESNDLYMMMCKQLIRDIQFRQQMLLSQKYETMSVSMV